MRLSGFLQWLGIIGISGAIFGGVGALVATGIFIAIAIIAASETARAKQ